MTTPVVRGTTTTGNTTSASSPSSTQIGDFVLMVTLEYLSNAAQSSLTIASGQGWAQLANYFHNDASTDAALGIAWKPATVAGTQTYQAFTTSNGSIVRSAIRVYESGTFDTSSILCPTPVSYTTEGTDPTSPSVSGLDSGRDYLIEAISGWVANPSGGINIVAIAPPSHTNLMAGQNSLGTVDIALATRAISGATSYGGGVWDSNGTATTLISSVGASVAILGVESRRRCEVGWAELELPDANIRRAIIGMAEFEVPPGDLRRGVVGWAEFQIGDYLFPLNLTFMFHRSWARYRYEANNPTNVTERFAKIGQAALEVPDIGRRAIIGFCNLEVPPAPSLGILFGVNSGPGSTSESTTLHKYDSWETWIGRQIDMTSDYVHGQGLTESNGWSNIANPTWWWNWDAWLAARPNNKILFSIGTAFPTAGKTAWGGTMLSAIAAGTYDTYYRSLGRNLAINGLASSRVYLAILNEYDGHWYPWGTSPNLNGGNGAPYFAAAFRRILDQMRSAALAAGYTPNWIPTICLSNGDGNRHGLTWFNTTWPGDSYVASIGIDTYDKWWYGNSDTVPSSFTQQQKEARWADMWSHHVDGLNTFSSWAALKGKPMALHEWGVTQFLEGGYERGGLDNPSFVQNIYDYTRSHNFWTELYFNRNFTGQGYRIEPPTNYPNASALYKTLWGG